MQILQRWVEDVSMSLLWTKAEEESDAAQGVEVKWPGFPKAGVTGVSWISDDFHGFPGTMSLIITFIHFPFRMGTFMAFHGNQQRPVQPCRRLLPGGPPSALPPVWLQCDFQLLDARPGFGKN